ncbi:MAG: cardiolipin synthase [Planctomycetales bacterium]|nr:cardiolipin synthase [Planctomycetales bacterium]
MSDWIERLTVVFGEDVNWSAVFFTLLIAVQIAIVLRVLMRRLEVGVSMAWVLVVAGFPIAGPLLYLMFGELRLGSKRAQRFKVLGKNLGSSLEKISDARQDPGPDQGGPFAHLAERLLGLPSLGGGKLTLLGDWQASFDAILADIRAAEKSCHLEFYIWSDGGRADEVVEALIAAAGRGVQCRMLLDALGSRPFLRGKTVKRLRNAGIEVVAALPGGVIRLLFVRFDLRLHRKIVVIDGRIAYTGSMNLVDPRYFKQSAGVGEWVDAMTRIEGPPVQALAISFLADWYVESGESLAEFDAEDEIHSLDPVGDTIVQAIPSGPAYGANAMERALITAVYSARDEIILTTPYFVPDEPLEAALASAALRGVRVVLVLPKKVDSMLVRHACNAFVGELVDSGVEVIRFTGGLLHTKSVTIDGEWSLFGSLNLDPRSLHLNFELTLGVYDEGFTQQLRALQMEYVSQSEQLLADRAESKSAGRLAMENLARFVSPLL